MAKKKQEVLTHNFIVELFKLSISNINVLEVMVAHLEFNFLPEDHLKNTWKHISDFYELTNKCPSIGVLTERIKDDQKSLDFLLEIKKCKIPEADQVLPVFEQFIKEVRFKQLYKEVADLYNAGDQDGAYSSLAKESENIHTFSLKKGMYGKVFADFEKRHEARKNKEHQSDIKIPIGIHALDYDTRGGIRVGTSALVLGRSGTGKTTFLEWVAIAAARIGLRVVHFQIEGTEEELMEAYDAAWTGTKLEDIEFGGIAKEKMLKIKNVANDIIKNKGEIYVIAPEEFGSLYIEDCLEKIEDIEKSFGRVNLVLFDNLELFDVKGKYPNTEAGERKRREKIANKITDIAIFKKCASIATTQAKDIEPSRYNNPDFVMTRSDINEFKGMVKPFSYFWTWNVTDSEYETNTGRMYADKFRKHKAKQVRYIATSFEQARFYNSKRTLNEFWDDKNNAPI